MDPSSLGEKELMPANWSRDDCLNHVADKIPIGNVDSGINCQYELIELQAEAIMKDLIIPNSWYLQMKEGTTPIMADFQQQIENRRLVIYLQKRDGYRAPSQDHQDGRTQPQSWQHKSMTSTNYLYHRHHTESN